MNKFSSGTILSVAILSILSVNLAGCMESSSSSNENEEPSSSSISEESSNDNSPSSNAGSSSSDLQPASSEATSSSSMSQSSSSTLQDSFTDKRDNKTYKLVKIGNQTWMAENLHFADSITYDFADARKVCPQDFHLPSLKELQTLVEFAGGDSIAGKKLKTTSGWPIGEYGNWNGTNELGFNATPVASGSGAGTDENFWSSTRNFGDFITGDFLKINPYPTSKYSCSTPENTTPSSATCILNADPETKLSVRCMSDIVDCGSTTFNSNNQFCQNGSVYTLCRKRSYDATIYECKNDTLYERSTGEVYKFSWVLLNKSLTYGKIQDARDGQYYKTIDIDGTTWFAENLNYASNGSICYNNEEYYCDIYGRMYTQKQALDGDSSKAEQHQGLCPDGFHLMTHTEYGQLYDNYHSDYKEDLYSEYHEEDFYDVYTDHKNKTGFSLALAGIYYYNNLSSYEWSSLNRQANLIGSNVSHGFIENYYENYMNSEGSNAAGSVRCVKN